MDFIKMAKAESLFPGNTSWGSTHMWSDGVGPSMALRQPPHCFRSDYHMSRWLGPERSRNLSFISSSSKSTICQPSTVILIIVVFFPSLTPWLHDHLWQYQEVKVQVISAEKCQSWFQSAHRQETLLIWWGCQGKWWLWRRKKIDAADMWYLRHNQKGEDLYQYMSIY